MVVATVAGVGLLVYIAAAQFYGKTRWDKAEGMGALIADGGTLTGGGHMAGDAVAVLRRILDGGMTADRIGADRGMTAKAQVVAGNLGGKTIAGAVGSVAVQAAYARLEMLRCLPFGVLLPVLFDRAGRPPGVAIVITCHLEHAR